MGTRLLSIMLALVAVGMLAVSAAAAGKDVYEGRVMLVGEDAISVMGDMEMNTFSVTAETTITYAGSPARLIDIHPGDRAVIEATTTGGRLVARSIMAAPRM
jgi:hypothetical protein